MQRRTRKNSGQILRGGLRMDAHGRFGGRSVQTHCAPHTRTHTHTKLLESHVPKLTTQQRKARPSLHVPPCHGPPNPRSAQPTVRPTHVPPGACAGAGAAAVTAQRLIWEAGTHVPPNPRSAQPTFRPPQVLPPPPGVRRSRSGSDSTAAHYGGGNTKRVCAASS